MYTAIEFYEIKLDLPSAGSKQPAATLLKFNKFGSKTDLKFITLIFHKETN